MKAAALVVECDDGKIHAVGSNSLATLRVLARQVRDARAIDIGKRTVAVKCGALLASWRSMPDMQFRC
jgi:hypothetical protein